MNFRYINVPISLDELEKLMYITGQSSCTHAVSVAVEYTIGNIKELPVEDRTKSPGRKPRRRKNESH